MIEHDTLCHSQLLTSLLTRLSEIISSHSPQNAVYKLLKDLIKPEIRRMFQDASEEAKDFGPFGQISFPYFEMGAIDSVDLFGIDELIIYNFYWNNRDKYKKVLDIGGNIGLHSIIMDRCGFQVSTYEPDQTHYTKLLANLKLNNCKNVIPFQEAVSSKNGSAEFVRVLGNTTSSHLAGSKVPYGDLETYKVPIRNIKDIVKDADFMKMDVEGHEKEILLALDKDDWVHLDAMVEIGTDENAQSVFESLQKNGINAFAQKLGWQKVNSVNDMPVTHREGSLFITQKASMPWAK